MMGLSSICVNVEFKVLASAKTQQYKLSCSNTYRIRAKVFSELLTEHDRQGVIRESALCLQFSKASRHVGSRVNSGIITCSSQGSSYKDPPQLQDNMINSFECVI
jgi:hypothetical protein